MPTELNDRCVRKAIEVAKRLNKEYNFQVIVPVTGEQLVVSDLLGNIAFDHYRSCVESHASSALPPDSRLARPAAARPQPKREPGSPR